MTQPRLILIADGLRFELEINWSVEVHDLKDVLYWYINVLVGKENDPEDVDFTATYRYKNRTLLMALLQTSMAFNEEFDPNLKLPSDFTDFDFYTEEIIPYIKYYINAETSVKMLNKVERKILYSYSVNLEPEDLRKQDIT